MGDLSEENISAVPKESSPQPNLDRGTYANRSSRLRIARMIEEADSTPKHPYVSIIRGREIDSVDSFASGVIEILRLHGYVVIDLSNPLESEEKRTAGNARDVVYVVNQAEIEKAVRSNSRNYPLSTTQILNILNLNMEGNARAIFKVTTDFSRNIIGSVGAENANATSIKQTVEGVNTKQIGNAMTTIGMYFGSATFLSIAGLDGAIFYLLNYLIHDTLAESLISLLIPIAISLSVLSYLLRIAGMWVLSVGERISLGASVILYSISVVMVLRFLPSFLGLYEPGNVSHIGAVIEFSGPGLLLLAYLSIIAAQVGLFGHNGRNYLYGLLAGSISAVFLALDFFMFYLKIWPELAPGLGLGFYPILNTPGTSFYLSLPGYIWIVSAIFNVVIGYILFLSGKHFFDHAQKTGPKGQFANSGK